MPDFEIAYVNFRTLTGYAPFIQVVDEDTQELVKKTAHIFNHTLTPIYVDTTGSAPAINILVLSDHALTAEETETIINSCCMIVWGEDI